MTMPNRNDAAAVTGTSFWTIVLGFWLLLLVVGGTLAIVLGIWNLIEAF